MQSPKLPSFFKTVDNKRFSFKPRYYDKQKERKEELIKGIKTKIKFSKNHIQKKEKGRNKRIIIMIIILSLLCYKFIIN